MSRKQRVYWHARNAAWCAAAGDFSDKTGRRKVVYFRGHAKTKEGQRNAQADLDRLLEVRESRVRTGEDFTFIELAQAYLSTILRDAAARHFRDEHITPPENLALWLRSDEGQAWKRELHTYLGHRKALRKFAQYSIGAGTFGAKVARTLVVGDLKTVVDAMAAQALAPNYIARMVSSVQAVMNWSATPAPGRKPERLLHENPFAKFAHEACQAGKTADKFATDAEIEAFIAWGKGYAEKRGGVIGRFDLMTIKLIEVAAMTGSRPGELRKARWQDFKPDATTHGAETWGLISLPPHRWKSGRKTKRVREVYLPPGAVAIIESIREIPGHHPEYIWTNRRGPRSKAETTRDAGVPWTVTSLCRRVKYLREKAALEGVPVQVDGTQKFVLYRLRHTQAANLLKAGQPIAVVAKLLGTSIAMIEEVYASFLPSHLAAAASSVVRPQVIVAVPPGVPE